MLGGICRVAAWAFVGLTAPAVAAPTTAWNNNHFDVDVANLVRRSNIIVQAAPATGPQSMPVGNGTLGAAVWAANGFTAQLNRWDTYPNRRSPGQVVIPGLAPMTAAGDYTASVDLYDATFKQSGGGMTATTYVRADKDELVIDVTGADPSAAQTATLSLQSGRNPTAGASAGIARLAETWVDTASFDGGSGRTFGSLAAVTAGARNVTASVVDARTARVSFNANADGSFRVIVAAPAWTGGDAAAAAQSLIGTDTTGTINVAHLAWWHDYWSKVGLAKFSSADGVADYMENLRTLFLYIEAASERGTFPTSQAGVNPLFNFSRDSQSWGGGHYWFWNLRMQLAANLGAGNFDFNLPRFHLYTDNLAAIRTWTTLHMNMRPGICVPETMRFDGTGWYTGTDNENASCISDGTPSYNKRNLSSGAEVGLNIWRQYLATDDRAFLDASYPVMADAARFLLSYATTGADGKLHTSPSNAHESQWDVHDPITDIAAMKALFPVVIQAATLLGKDPDLVTQLQAAMPKLLDFPRTDFTHTQLKTAANDGDGNTVLGFSSDPTAAFRNSENLDLEPVFPYEEITDQSPLFDLAKLTYAHKRNTNSNDWSYDPVDAARLGMGAEVAARLKATTSSFQLFANGMANLGSGGTLTEPYDEHSGVTALALNEALVQDYDGLLRIAPAVPPGWDAEGTIFIQHRTKVSVQVQGGVITTAAVVSGADHDIRVKNPWPDAQVVSGADPSQVVVPTTTDAIFTIHATSGGTYMIQRPSAPTAALPKATLTGTPASAPRHLAGANVKIGIDPPGTEPPPPCPIPTASPLFAWDPSSGATIKDASTYGRDALWSGTPTYLASGPTGSAASIDGGRYLRTAPTTLGFLREATFAAEVKINAGTSYRRLWDWKTPSGGDGDGFLIDLTPAGAIRVITSGVNVTATATPPTGRFISLVITAGRDGAVDVYVDGTRIGGGTINNLGINGCAAAELRFGADQGGGQRISAELDRTAVFTKALPAADIARWQQLAFASSVDAPGTVGGAVPSVLALSVAAPAADLGTFLPGVTRDYTASLGATVTTTTADAALSVSDPGHLTNGSFVMPQPLQVNVNGGAYSSAARTLLTYGGPKTLDAVTIGFKQPVAATDGLHTGAYGRTLTFTLSSTSP